VFDNRAYVAGGPDVVSHLHNKMPGGWRAALLAIDGATCSSVARQLGGLPPDATHLLVSAGGNDALGRSDILDASARSVADTLVKLSTIAGEFRAEYNSMLEALRRMGLPIAVCTIYDPRFPEPLRRELGRTALAVINDVILREASVCGLPVLDLRLVCDEDADLASDRAVCPGRSEDRRRHHRVGGKSRLPPAPHRSLRPMTPPLAWVLGSGNRGRADDHFEARIRPRQGDRTGWLIEILLPLASTTVHPFLTPCSAGIRRDLVAQFGGLTAFIRSPRRKGYGSPTPRPSRRHRRLGSDGPRLGPRLVSELACIRISFVNYALELP
jgi:hypothetical protein